MGYFAVQPESDFTMDDLLRACHIGAQRFLEDTQREGKVPILCKYNEALHSLTITDGEASATYLVSDLLEGVL